MSIQRINEFPEGSGSLSNDDVFLFMDDPSGSGITKKISLSQISNAIGGGGNSFTIGNIDLHNGGVQSAQILQFNDSSKQSVITGPTPAENVNAQRLIIQGQRGSGTGEGGDVYFWGGDADTNGGDIKIYAGDADSNSSGYGGYVNIDAGNGYNQGGNVSISAGNSSEQGGDVTITAGYSPAISGVVYVRTGGGNKQWAFNNDGAIVFPNNTTVAVGTFDNSTGGNNGISLNCYVGYELNWQGGHLKSTQDGGISSATIWCDSPIEFPGSGIDNVEINNIGITFADGTTQTTAATSGLWTKNYGSFYDTTTQINASVTGVNTMTFNTTDVSQNISIVDGSKLTFYHSGIYNIQFSAQIDKIDGGDDGIDIWLDKNGNPVDWTNTRMTLHAQDAKSVAAWNFVMPMSSGDYLQFKWYSNDIDLRILAQSGLVNPTRPNIPSIILTVIEI